MPPALTPHVSKLIEFNTSCAPTFVQRAGIEAIRREPKFVYAYNNLSQTLRLMGQLDEAAEMARKAIELAPKGREGYSNLALVLIEQGKGDEALNVRPL